MPFFIKPCHNNVLCPLQVGFCNIIKRAKDQVNHLWVAEASENSTYFLSFNTPHCSHLKDAAASAERWGKISTVVCILGFLSQVRGNFTLITINIIYWVPSQTIDKLREKVLSIVGDCKG